MILKRYIKLENWRPTLRRTQESFALLFFVINFKNASPNGSREWVERRSYILIELITFKSSFILTYFVYPNTHPPGQGSQILPHKRLEFVVGSFLQLIHLVHVSFWVRSDIFKFQFDQLSEFVWVCQAFYVKTPIFSFS